MAHATEPALVDQDKKQAIAMSQNYRLLEHTADIGIEARGETLEGLFHAMACGLREVISSTVQLPPDLTISVQIVGQDYGELLVNWLNEILFLLESRNLFPVDFLIDSLQEGRLEARVRGVSAGAGTQISEREVKAATYHQLKVEKRDGIWHARIYLDL